MNQMSEPQRLRQDYLRMKGVAYCLLTARLFACLILVLAALWMFRATQTLTHTSRAAFKEQARERRLNIDLEQGKYMDFWQEYVALAGGAFVVSLALAYVGYRQSRTVIHAYHNATRIPYVPPVTASTVPTEAILVRGSIEPDAPAETLLRAAQANVETAPDQLLRVVPGAAGEQGR